MIEGITKKQRENGKPVYFIDGREIDIYVAEFDEILNIELQKINSMFQAILDTECDDYLDMNFAYIGRDLVENLENIESDIGYHINGECMRIVQNVNLEMLPNKKRIKKDSIIDVFFESTNGKAPETELANKESGA